MGKTNRQNNDFRATNENINLLCENVKQKKRCERATEQAQHN